MTSAADIIAALGGDPASGMCRCPAHNDERPSLHVADGDRKMLLFCHTGCEFREIANALARRGIGTRCPRRGKGREGLTRTVSRPASADTAEALASALRLPDGRPREYLLYRGIRICPRSLHLLAAGTMAAITGFVLPAMVVEITNAEDDTIGIHCTFLTRDCRHNARGRSGNLRRIYGRFAGGYVPLGRPDPDGKVIIGEGIESTLAAMQLAGDVPGIAALSANNLAKITVPRCREVIICADNDTPGRRGAEQLADRLCGDRIVRVAIPDGTGMDWNDILLTKEVRRGAA